MFSKCFRLCCDKRRSYGVTPNSDRRPSVEGAPSTDDEAPDSTLSRNRPGHPAQELREGTSWACFSNEIPKPGTQVVSSSLCFRQHGRVTCSCAFGIQPAAATSEATSSKNEAFLEDHRTSTVKICPSVHEFSPEPLKNDVDETSETNEKPIAKSADAIDVSELVNPYSVSKAKQDTEEAMQSEDITENYNEKTIGEKFEDMHTGKTVLKIGTRKRERIQDPTTEDSDLTKYATQCEAEH